MMLLKSSPYDRIVAKWKTKQSRLIAKRAADFAHRTWSAELRRLTWVRDLCRCRACRRLTWLVSVNPLRLAHRHHVVYLSAGGDDTIKNSATLCPECHSLEHIHLLDITGSGDGALHIVERDKDGTTVREWESPCPS